ncbi:MAG TPA: hypothetical protein VER03_08970 [Bryobacteraceae bacterium]|nr:hypothetical protein [Bryobacteraceae bacterium]
MFALILRVYSYLYHLVLCLFLLGISIVATSTSNTLKLPMLPWTGADLNAWLLWGSLAGLVSLVLAVTGVFRFLFPLWTLAVFALMFNGFILKPYTFAGKLAFYNALWLLAGAFLAFLASLTLFRAARTKRA